MIAPSTSRSCHRAKRANSIGRALLQAGVLASFAWSAFAADSPIDLDRYGAVLKSHTRRVAGVVGVEVDYAAIARDARWKQVVQEVERARPSRLSRDEQIAFWINAYNILTIDLVRKHYPVDSIKDIGSLFSPVWNVDVARIEGKSMSLGEIEHEILRPMGEPRIHAAIVCASTSCPPLATTPYRPDRIDEDLSDAMRRFLSSSGKGLRIDRAARRVTISKIFDWFEEDFEPAGGALPTIARFVSERDAAWLRSEGKRASVRYFGYDWSLNDFER